MHICFHIRDDVDFNQFIRDLEARIAELEAAAEIDGERWSTMAAAAAAEAGELRDALRLGRLLLAGHEVTL